MHPAAQLVMEDPIIIVWVAPMVWCFHLPLVYHLAQLVIMLPTMFVINAPLLVVIVVEQPPLAPVVSPIMIYMWPLALVWPIVHQVPIWAMVNAWIVIVHVLLAHLLVHLLVPLVILVNCCKIMFVFPLAIPIIMFLVPIVWIVISPVPLAMVELIPIV